MKKMVKVTCDFCKKEVLKPVGEYNRRIRLGKDKFYCNNVCGSKIEAFVERLRPFRLHGSAGGSKRGDEFSNYRWYMKCIKNNNRVHKREDFDIDLQYLKELWEKQDGVCPLSGIKMKLRTHQNCKDGLGEPYSASIDRIDNDLGYVRGNVRYICFMANIARSRFSDEQLINFCNSVTDHNLGN